MRISRASLLAGLVFVVMAAGVLCLGPGDGLIEPPIAQAQNFGSRAVTGAVVDANSDPVAGAIVFLRNQKTKTIRSYTSTNNGRFSFAQVSMTEDYDLWAEKGAKKSAVKTVSSWDSRKSFEVELKLK